MGRAPEIFQKLEVGEKGSLVFGLILSSLLVIAAVGVGLWAAAILFP